MPHQAHFCFHFFYCLLYTPLPAHIHLHTYPTATAQKLRRRHQIDPSCYLHILRSQPMDIFKAKLTWGLVISALVLQFMGASSCSLICPVDIFDLPVPRLLSWLLPKLLPIPPPLEQHFSIWFNPLYRYGSVLRFFIYPLLHRGSGLLMFNLLGFIPLGLYLETGQDVIVRTCFHSTSCP